MPYEIPRLDALSQRARQLFAQAIPGAVVTIWPNSFTVVAKVLAAAGFEIHLRLAWLSRQMFASSADDEWLQRHGFEVGVNRLPAQRAVGQVTVSGPVGVAIPAGVVYERADGQRVRSRHSAIGSASVEIAFEAVDAGAAGNAAAGETLTLVDNGGVVGLGQTAIVATGGLGGGADREERETFRARVLLRKRNPPQGGSASDWEAWVRASNPLVARVFVDSFSNSDRRVWIAVTFADRANGVPTSGDIAQVQDALDQPDVRPVTARVTVVAPTPVAVAVTAIGLQPSTVAVQAAIRAELAAMFSERMLVATPTRPFILPRAWVSEAISRATGEDRHTLTLPAADITFATPGQLPVLGTVTLS